jgi:hypothetical protein
MEDPASAGFFITYHYTGRVRSPFIPILATYYLFSWFRFAQKYFLNLCVSFSTWGPPVIRVKNILWAKQVLILGD